MNTSVQPDDARFLELLDRWARGEFTRADERELHALANADDFRREAWEGFMALPEANHESRLNALRGRFRKRPGGRRVPFVLWMAAAATLVALLAALYFIPAPESKHAQPLARHTPPAEAAPAADAPADLEPKGESYAVNPDATAKFSKKTAPRASKSRATQPASPVPEDDLAETAQERVLDENKDQNPLAAPPPPSTRLGDSVPVVAGGPASQAQQLPVSGYPGGPAGNAAPMQKTSNGEPVTYSPAPQIQAETADKAASRAAAKKKPDSAKPQATPAGGWDNFRLYLLQNARLTEAARNHQVSGNVRLTFDVGKDGKPVNIIVVQSLGYGCDEAAIRLLQAFYWMPFGAEPVTLDIPFIR